jgi:hypothetical protein
MCTCYPGFLASLARSRQLVVAIIIQPLTAETLNNGTPGKLKIGNVLIWQLQKGKWKLLACQAYK